jgi:hypothetical protein
MCLSLVEDQPDLLRQLPLVKLASTLFWPIELSHPSTKLAVKVSCPMRWMHCGGSVWIWEAETVHRSAAYGF